MFLTQADYFTSTSSILKFSSLPSYAVVMYLALLSACAYTLWGILLKYNKVSQVSIYGFMTPVFGFLLSSIVLRETLSQQKWITALALILVCLGIFTVNLSGEKFKKILYKNKKDNKEKE